MTKKREYPQEISCWAEIEPHITSWLPFGLLMHEQVKMIPDSGTERQIVFSGDESFENTRVGEAPIQLTPSEALVPCCRLIGHNVAGSFDSVLRLALSVFWRQALSSVRATELSQDRG